MTTGVEHITEGMLQMPTKQEDVLRLAKAAGLLHYLQVNRKFGFTFPFESSHASIDVIAKLIALAKQSAYEDAASLLERSCPPEVYVWVAAEKIRNRAKEQS